MGQILRCQNILICAADSTEYPSAAFAPVPHPLSTLLFHRKHAYVEQALEMPPFTRIPTCYLAVRVHKSFKDRKWVWRYARFV